MAKVNKNQWKTMLKALAGALTENRKADLRVPRSFWEQWKEKKVIARATTSPRTVKSPHK